MVRELDSESFTTWIKLLRNSTPTCRQHITTLPPLYFELRYVHPVRNRTLARCACPRAHVEEKIGRFRAA